MNADLAYSSGELTLIGYSLENATITENWWQKYGRIVEFQLIFTTASSISAENQLAGGLPRAAQSGTFTTFGTTGNVVVKNQSGGAYLENTVFMNGTVVLHGVYISET